MGNPYNQRADNKQDRKQNIQKKETVLGEPENQESECRVDQQNKYDQGNKYRHWKTFTDEAGNPPPDRNSQVHGAETQQDPEKKGQQLQH